MSLLGENREAVDTILAIGLERAKHSDDANRIASTLGIFRYLYLSDLVRRVCPRNARLLDLGGGYGQLSFFLKNWGYDVTVFEVRSHYETVLAHLGLTYLIQPEGDLSIFHDRSMDAVIEVAVLELIEDKTAFIRNTRRVLRDGGYYFCCLFPNKSYWLSKLGIRGRSEYSSPRDYGPLEISTLFRQEGFVRKQAEFFQFLPMNMVKVNRLVEQIWTIDRTLCHISRIGRLSNMFNLVFKLEN